MALWASVCVSIFADVYCCLTGPSVCCCVRVSLAQICYILLPDIMGTGLHRYRLVPPLTAVIPVCLATHTSTHQAPASHETTSSWKRNKGAVTGPHFYLYSCTSVMSVAPMWLKQPNPRQQSVPVAHTSPAKQLHDCFSRVMTETLHMWMLNAKWRARC